MTDLSQLKFYATHPHPCSYLPEERATTLLTNLGFTPELRARQMSALSGGWKVRTALSPLTTPPGFRASSRRWSIWPRSML